MEKETAVVEISQETRKIDKNPTLAELVHDMAVRARCSQKLLSISDARYITVGIPKIITDQFIYFESGWEVGRTGKLGNKPLESEKIVEGGKIILFGAVISIEMAISP